MGLRLPHYFDSSTKATAMMPPAVTYRTTRRATTQPEQRLMGLKVPTKSPRPAASIRQAGAVWVRPARRQRPEVGALLGRIRPNP